MNLEDALQAGLGGNAVLFCGAGFSADCLNFSGVPIGTGHPLQTLLNHELGFEFEDLQTAADEYLTTKGEHRLYRLLKDRYQAVDVPSSVGEILSYPWRRIYTTNYDDSISQALKRLHIPHIRLNNLDRPEKQTIENNLSVVHLHGAAECWDEYNFSQSCILGAQSYLNHSSGTPWKTQLEEDFNRATAFFFIGFSARDFYLNQVFFNASTSRDKVFFINSKFSINDRGLIANQRKFGASLPIGREEFAALTREAQKNPPPSRPRLASFEEVQRSTPARTPPGIEEVTDHFVLGILDDAYLVRDIDFSTNDYRVRRDVTNEVIQHLCQAGSIALITGSVCTGKSLLAHEVGLSVASERPVFQLRIAYDDIVKEVATIANHYPDALLIIEDCFLLGPQLIQLANALQETRVSLLLTSRDVAYDAAADDLIVAASNRNDRLKRFPLSKLTYSETSQLVSISDRIAGWSEFSGRTVSWKCDYVARTCHSNLAEFLLHLLKSKQIRDRIDSEYSKTIALSPELVRPIIVSLYLQHIGLPAQIEVVSSLLEMDVGALLMRPAGKQKFELIRRDGSFIRTLPSIGAREILGRIVEDADIVSIVTGVVKNLSENRRHGSTYTHIFNQFMRYPLLQGVVDKKSEIDRFFDDLSLHPWVQRQSHFWLQFSMAKTDFGEFDRAQKYLDNAFGIARSHEERGDQHGFKQLDDQRAKFLLKSRTKDDKYGDYFPVFREVSLIITRILNLSEITFHVYDTLVLLCDFIDKRFPDEFDVTQHDVVLKTMSSLTQKSKMRSDKLVEFHEMNRASTSIARLESTLSRLTL